MTDRWNNKAANSESINTANAKVSTFPLKKSGT